MSLKMPDKDFDYLFPQAKANPVELRGYVWKVFVDPTRKDDDPGMFFGRLFRMIDIRLNRDERSTWSEGIVFAHITPVCRLTYQDGLLMDLTNSKVIQKKPRVRDRSQRSTCRSDIKGKSMTIKPNHTSSNSQMISGAVDMLVQIGIRHEVRRVTAISNVAKDLKNGEVFFEPIYQRIEESSGTEPIWDSLGKLC